MKQNNARYERVGGGEYTLCRLLMDYEFTSTDGRKMVGKAGDVLVTRWKPLPVKQWPIEPDAAKEFYVLLNKETQDGI